MNNENQATEFLTNSEFAALALYFCLKRDGKNPRHSSALHQQQNPVKWFHLHRVYCEIPLEIMNSYVQYESDRFILTFLRARYLTRSCEIEAPKQKYVLTCSTNKPVSFLRI